MLGLCGEVCFKDNRPSLSGMDVMLQSLPQLRQGFRNVHLSGAICFGAVTRDQKDGPKSFSELGLSIVLQGFISNKSSLLEELSSEGVSLASDDVRNIIAGAFTLWGLDCFKRFEGRFAIGIYEHLRGRLCLARDAAGQEPLYIAHDEAEGRLFFATSLPMIAKRDEISSDIDPVSLNLYCSYQSAVPAPFTLLKAVKKLPAGCVAVFEGQGERTNHIFRKISFASDADFEGFETAEWTALIHRQLERSLQHLDSMGRPLLVEVGEIGQLLQKHINRPTSAYAIHLEGYGDPRLDQLMEHWDGSAQQVTLGRRDVFESLPDALRAMSEPAPYSNGIYRFAALQQLGVEGQLAIDGHGLVEALGARSWYQHLASSNDLSRDYARHVFCLEPGDYKRQVSEHYLDEDFALSFLTGQFEMDHGAHPLDKVLRFDIMNKVIEGPAHWETHYHRALGVDNFRPFLSPDMVRLMGSIPSDLKTGERVLAKSLFPEKPAAITAQRLPSLVQFLNGSIRDFFQDVFHSQAARDRQIFKAGHLAQLLESREIIQTPTGGSKLMQAAMIELWFQAHGL